MKNKPVISDKTKLTIVIPDTHLSPPLGPGCELPDASHDPDALSIVLQVIKEVQPDQIIHLGDIADVPQSSHFTEKINRMGQTLAADGSWHTTQWGQTLELIDGFWEGIHEIAPKAELHQLEGNHDLRVERMLSDPFTSQFREQLSLRNRPIWKRLNIKYYPYNSSQKPGSQPWVTVGNTHVLHGYMSATPTMMEKEHDNVMYGHCHRHELSFGTDRTAREYSRKALSIGCLCKLDPEFASLGGKQSGWVHGFGLIYTKGEHTVKEFKEISKGVFIRFDGKEYTPRPLGSIHPKFKILEL